MKQTDTKDDKSWFQQLYYLSPDPAWVIEDSRFVECNAAAVKTLGYTSRHDLLSLHPSKISPSFQADGEDSFSKAERMISIALKKGLHRFEWIHTKADGSNLDVEVTLSSVTIFNRHVIYAVWRDLSARKLTERILEDERDRMGIILNNLDEPIFLKDNDHRIVFANAAFCDLFNISKSLVIGKTLAEQVPENERAQFLAVDRLVLDEGISDTREETLTLNGLTHTILTRKRRYVNNFGENFLLGSISDITERKRSEEALRQSDALYRSMAETLPLAIYVSSGLDQICEYVNPAFVDMFGYVKEEVSSAAKWWPLAYPDRDYRESVESEWQSKVEYAIKTLSKTTSMESKVTCKDGSVRDISWAFIALGEKNYSYGLDLTERKVIERDQAIAATAFNAQEGMIVTDEQGNILKVNQAFCLITGFSSTEVLGKNPRFLQSGRQDPDFYLDMWSSLRKSGYWEGELWNRRQNGDVYPVFLTITAVKDGAGTVINYVATFNDITQSKKSADAIQHLAFYDPLTRLPNRRLLLDRLSKTLASMNRSGGRGALLFLDLDHFKNLNDTLGHDIGDLLLQQVSHRLRACVRGCDTVGRLGGDEFVVMLEDLSRHSLEAVEQANLIAEKIMSSLSHPYQLGTHNYENTSSIGITMIENSSHTVNELLKQADIAMYQSKNEGRNRIRFFDPMMQENLNARIELESELSHAIDQQQFQLYYQKQVDVSGRTIGAEALIRWNHPRGILVSPAEFIAHAETSGLIQPIGDWVLESSCKMLQSWQQHEQTRKLTLSVNVSARQFRDSNFRGRIEQLVNDYGINPARLKLELTESLLLVDIEEAITKITALNRIGIRLVLDDFGTGYSSLQYLKRLPLDEIKIDQSFIRDIEMDAGDRAIVTTIIAMAKSLVTEVIAEGVETEAQKNFLIDQGCRRFQGFLFGKPIPAEQFFQSLQD
jgi:diguanylate cyclase (GGDEF)-like protein/PAS domain S-box-containing protein